MYAKTKAADLLVTGRSAAILSFFTVGRETQHHRNEH